MRQTLTVLDFGTSKIVALVAETSGRQRCDIIGAGTVSYDGFSNRQWNDPSKLNEAIFSAVHEAEEQSRINKIRDIQVGVPGEFCKVRTAEITVPLQGADPQVTDKDIRELMERAREEMDPTLLNYVIYSSPAWFTVDDGKKTVSPVGIRGHELRGMVSFVIADSFFMEDVNARLQSLGIAVSGFMPSVVGQAMLYISGEERDRTAVLVDVGYLNTDVMVVEGDTITYLKTIPIGGGHIAADLCYGLEITLNSAEQIKRNYVYGLSTGSTSFEGTTLAGENKTFTYEEVGKVLEPRADEICDQIKEAIKESGVRLGNWSPVYLTGGGLILNKGGKDLLSAKLDKPVKKFPNKAVKLSNPSYSSALGLLDLLISTFDNERARGGVGGFFRSLFGS